MNMDITINALSKFKAKIYRILSNICGYRDRDNYNNKDIDSDNIDLDIGKAYRDYYIPYDDCINLDIGKAYSKEIIYESIKLLYKALSKVDSYLDNSKGNIQCMDRAIQYIPCIDTLIFRYVQATYFHPTTGSVQKDIGYLYDMNMKSEDFDNYRTLYIPFRLCLRRVIMPNKYAEYKILLKSENNNNLVVEKTVHVNSKLWGLANSIFHKADKNGFLFKGYMNDFLYAISYYRNMNRDIGCKRPIQGFDGIKLYNSIDKFSTIEFIPSEITRVILYNGYKVYNSVDKIERK